MSSKDGSSAETPRFDSVMAAAEGRRDDWQRLQSLTQAWAAAGAGAAAGPKLSREAQELLSSLKPLESFWAFPGPVLMQKLRARISGGDASGAAVLARRLAKAVLGGTYRRDDSLWSENGDEESTEAKSRAPSYARGDG